MKVRPPAVLGTLPDDVEDNPTFGKFFGAPPSESPDPRIINGNAASGGKVTGTARVIMSLDGQERLATGEILVCPATMPPWTPLFGIAAAGMVTGTARVIMSLDGQERLVPGEILVCPATMPPWTRRLRSHLHKCD